MFCVFGGYPLAARLFGGYCLADSLFGAYRLVVTVWAVTVWLLTGQPSRFWSRFWVRFRSRLCYEKVGSVGLWVESKKNISRPGTVCAAEAHWHFVCAEVPLPILHTQICVCVPKGVILIPLQYKLYGNPKFTDSIINANII